MDENTFKTLAASFETAANYTYEFVTGKNGKKATFISSLETAEFTHIVGLDHISHIKALVGNKSKLKTILFDQMLRGDFTYSDIPSSDIAEFTKPIPNTYNSVTNQPYTVQDRIMGLLNMDSVLSNAYKGSVYKWDKNQCRVILKGKETRNTLISADYVLKIPSGRSSDENYYFFMVQSNKLNNKKTKQNEPIRLIVFSAFLECIDLTRGQERAMTILQETKVNLKTKEKEILYTHPAYKEDQPSQSTPKTNNVMKVQFDNPMPKNITVNSSGAIAADPPAPSFFSSMFDRLKQTFSNFFKSQDKPDNTFTEKEPQEESKLIEDNSSAAAPIPKEMAELLEAREAFAEKKINQDEYKQVITKYMYSLHGKEQWEAAVEQLAKQLDQAPVNIRGLIDFELKSVQHNFDKRFAPKTEPPRQTLDDIKRSAHEKYIKQQDKKAASPAQEYNDKDHQSPHIR